MRNGNIRLKLLRQSTLSRFEEVGLALDRVAGRVGVVERDIGSLKKQLRSLKDDVLSVRKAIKGTTRNIRDLFDYVGEVDTILSQHRSNRRVHLEVE